MLWRDKVVGCVWKTVLSSSLQNMVTTLKSTEIINSTELTFTHNSALVRESMVRALGLIVSFKIASV